MIGELCRRMNLNKIINIVLCLVIFATPVAFGQNCTAKVSIKTDIDNSKIYINSKIEGTGSVVAFLEKGIYTLRIMAPEKEWGKKTICDTLRVTDCSKDISLNYFFQNQRYLDSEPQDAEVIANDTVLGYTPLFIPMHYTEVTLNKLSYQSRNLELERDKTSQVIKLDFVGKHEEISFYKKPIFKYLLGGIVVLGAATAYFKIKADDSFSDYQRTTNNSFLDDTHKYDLLSGIAFGALQVNLGVLIYYFLSD